LRHLNTHHRSTSYTCKIFQRLRWLVVIWMQYQPDVCRVSQSGHSRRVCGFYTSCSLLQVFGYDCGTPPPTCFLLTSGLRHTYNLIQYILLQIDVMRTQSQPDIPVCWVSYSKWQWRVGGFFTCGMCYVMIGAPHPLHTHIMSLSYIYKVF